MRDAGKRHSLSQREALPGNISQILSVEREVRVWRPHSDIGVFRFLQFMIERNFRFRARPPSGKDSSPGEFPKLRSSRDVRFFLSSRIPD